MYSRQIERIKNDVCMYIRVFTRILFARLIEKLKSNIGSIKLKSRISSKNLFEQIMPINRIIRLKKIF